MTDKVRLRMDFAARGKENVFSFFLIENRMFIRINFPNKEEVSIKEMA